MVVVVVDAVVVPVVVLLVVVDVVVVNLARGRAHHGAPPCAVRRARRGAQGSSAPETAPPVTDYK